MLRTILVCGTVIATLVLGTVANLSVAVGQEAPKATGSYTDALRQCGAEWKASDTRKATPKGEGMKAWQTFRAECVKRVGWTSKRAK